MTSAFIKNNMINSESILKADRKSFHMEKMERLAARNLIVKPTQTYADPKASAVSGALAGAFGSFFVAPLDVVKARLQVQQYSPDSTLRYNGILRSLRTILVEEGIFGYFRGLPPTMMGYVLSYSCYFSCYDTLKNSFVNILGTDKTMLATILAAIGGGAFSNLVTNPFWLVRTRLQVQEQVLLQKEYLSTRHAFVKILREEGPLAFYKGLSASMLGLSHVAIQFPLFEFFKEKLETEGTKTRSVNMIMASSASKIIATVFTYPHEVARAKLHVNRIPEYCARTNRSPSVLVLLSQMVKHEGVLSIYRGLGTQLVRVTPACAVTFTTYDALISIFDKRRNN